MSKAKQTAEAAAPNRQAEVVAIWREDDEVRAYVFTSMAKAREWAKQTLAYLAETPGPASLNPMRRVPAGQVSRYGGGTIALYYADVDPKALGPSPARETGS